MDEMTALLKIVSETGFWVVLLYLLLQERSRSNALSDDERAWLREIIKWYREHNGTRPQ